MKKPYKKPNAGDKVEVIVNGDKQIGVLLESHDRGVMLLKLDNGYNIGLKKEDISEIKVISSHQPSQAASYGDDVKKLSGKKPIIDFYLTGGTISSKLDSETGGVKGLTNSKELFKIYPEIFEIADIRVNSPFMKSSGNMGPSDWIRIAKLVGKSLNDPHVKGVIVSHGTDTLHYTASALSFMLGKLNKPVVLTYSQRSSDRGSSDSRMNLVCSAYMALGDVAEILLVGHASTNDDYCYALQGNKCKKMHTSRRDTFRPINCKPYAKIWTDGKNENIREDYNKRNKDKVEVDAVFDTRIGLFKASPGNNPKVVNFYRKNCKGLVIEGTGLGHVAVEGKYSLIAELKKAIENGLLVYMASQAMYGRVDPYVYDYGRKLEKIGIVYLGDMLAETAYVKLGWVLGHKNWRGSVATKLKMLENVNGEYNERLGKEFLV